jgi:RNA polymerase sigma-70 factor (ECF subfamily)
MDETANDNSQYDTADRVAGLAELLRQHDRALQRFAFRLCGSRDQAHDIVQDTYERALGGEVWRLPARHARAWLFVVARNRFLDECRRRRRQLSLSDPASNVASAILASGQAPGAADSAEVVELEELNRAMARLGAKQQNALWLHAVQGLSYADIARRLQVPVNTVGTRIWRARERLRVALS